MNVFLSSRADATLAFLKRNAGKLLSVALVLWMLAPLAPVLAQSERQEQRAALREANRERWLQRQQEMQNLERNQDHEPQWQRRNRLGIPQQFDPPDGMDQWRDRRQGRMTLEERQALRRQIQEAGRSVYAPPPPDR